MVRIRRSLVGLLVALTMSTMLSVAPAGAGQPPSDPAAPGPWQVGLTTTTVVDPARDDRTLPMDVWYPVDDEDAVGVDEAELDLIFTTLGLDGVLADPQPADGTFPLVVFSHGSGGVRYQSWFLMEALASHGFVVAAPDHVGNTALDGLFGTADPFPVIARNRPLDVSSVIDEMIAQNADRTDPLAPVIDPDRIAVVGHSFGGFTALAAASGYQDVAADPRVDAIVPLAAAALQSDDELTSIDVPTMLISSTDDATVPIGVADRVWGLLDTQQAYRVDIVAGGHNSFTNACDLADAFSGLGLPPALLAVLTSSAEEACAPGLIDIDEAHRIIESYTVAFLEKTIGGNGSFTRYLTPSYPMRAGFDVLYERSLGHGTR